jgi:putative cardiolipin synthase
MPATRAQATGTATRSSRGSVVAGLLLCAIALGGCGSLPSLESRTPSHAFQDTASTPLGKTVAAEVARRPGLSGIEAVTDGRVAFGLRVALARAATRSIDIQTFIWHADATGMLLYEEMLRAAERGVRVRLLLDDVNTEGLDPIFALLDSQPNIELRLYNPFVGRGSRAVGFLGDFARLNRRMHNKSFTVDNQVAIVGGRNVANEYFEAGEDQSFADIDVMAIGAVVPAVSTEFDTYWNSASAYPARLIIKRDPAVGREEFAQRTQQMIAGDARKYTEAIARSPQAQALLAEALKFEWTTVRVVHDDPEKTLSTSEETTVQLLPRLQAAFGSPTQEFDLVSPYFVPGELGTEALVSLARRGVRVQVLTNSLAANDETSVHSGYARRRKALLRAGVVLYEIKPEAATIQARAAEIGKHSKAGLHAKTFAVDRRAIFVGSFNFDPRSAKLNTEMGLVIDSVPLAERLSKMFDSASPSLAYRVALDANGSLEWHDGAGATLNDEPDSSWGQRMKVRIFSWLPIEWLL